MKSLAFIALLFLPVSAPIETGEIQVYFSPHGGCTEEIVSQIDKSKTSVFVQAYSFTSAPIAKALVDAHNRGVDVEVILDKSQLREIYTIATLLKNAGIPVSIDKVHAIAHNKILIINSQVVITGSFNLTKAAEEKNAENLLIIKSDKLAEKYLENWKLHASHSNPL